MASTVAGIEQALAIQVVEEATGIPILIASREGLNMASKLKRKPLEPFVVK